MVKRSVIYVTQKIYKNKIYQSHNKMTMKSEKNDNGPFHPFKLFLVQI